MKVLGLDIASNTGWALLKDGKLAKYGMLNIPPEMNMSQKLKFFETNLRKILDDTKPDEVHIEDVFLGMSGVKTLAYLARLNGVAMSVCFNKVGDRIKLYQPPVWKANSFPGLDGMAKKAEIQVAVIKHFKLVPQTDLDNLIKPLSEFTEEDSRLEKQLAKYKADVLECVKILNRKKSSDTDKESAKASKDKLDIKYKELKQKIDQRKKTIEKIYKACSIALTAKCGLTADVSDSIGIAYCNI